MTPSQQIVAMALAEVAGGFRVRMDSALRYVVATDLGHVRVGAFATIDPGAELGLDPAEFQHLHDTLRDAYLTQQLKKEPMPDRKSLSEALREFCEEVDNESLVDAAVSLYNYLKETP